MLFATRSEAKVRELRPIMSPLGVDLVSLAGANIAYDADEESIEVHETFEDNALAKARWFHRVAAMPVLADDSGLEVGALGNTPGVRSKRWSGRVDLEGQALDDANNALLVRALEAVGGSSAAQYVCAAACVWSDGEAVVRGVTAGRVLVTPSGGGGFGYDPYFWSTELGMTFGDASLEAKNAISHRGRAFRELAERLGGMRGAPFR